MASSAETIRRNRGPALFERGYRPFFFGAAVLAATALPLWLGTLAFGSRLPTHLAALDWHAHEMIFGYVGAVVAGFLLTAIPNWTGRLPVAGWPLAMLAGLWLAGRLAMAFSASSPILGAVVEAAFLCTLAGVAWREVVAGGSRRNLPICVLVTLFAAANIGFHVAVLAELERGLAERVALGVTAFLITLVGGRVVPSFTRNWLAKQDAARLPSPFGVIDKLALAAAGIALAAWIVAPEGTATAILMAVAGTALAFRLARWRGWRTFGEPLVLILHVGYGWLPLWFWLTALHIARPAALDASTALHALTAGAIGTMTVAVMTRATLAHSGRPLRADGLTSAVYLLVVGGAALRVLAPLLPVDPLSALTAGGLMWAAGFALFATAYAPIFLRSKRAAARNP